MNKILILFIFIFSISGYAEDKVFIDKGEYKIITLENFNTDQLPHQLDRIRQPSDRAIGGIYLDQDTGQTFFVLIHDVSMMEFNRGYVYGVKNVRMKVNYITTIHNLKIYEFISWSN